ncbi:hypothetical protein ACJX0J_011165, partial [Zea mays]
AKLSTQAGKKETHLASGTSLGAFVPHFYPKDPLINDLLSSVYEPDILSTSLLELPDPFFSHTVITGHVRNVIHFGWTCVSWLHFGLILLDLVSPQIIRWDA